MDRILLKPSPLILNSNRTLFEKGKEFVWWTHIDIDIEETAIEANQLAYFFWLGVCPAKLAIYMLAKAVLSNIR